MYEFIFGFGLGILGAKLWKSPAPVTREAIVQVDEVFLPATIPIPIRNSKPFVPGQLQNFWGKDS
jgi:hypothetical protein